MFGALREASKIAPWEQRRKPRSLCEIDTDSTAAAKYLVEFVSASNNELFENSARCLTLIWAMRPNGALRLAIEEIAELPDGQELSGHPRRRNYPRHPSEEKKLGHPCLLSGEDARIAGELFLDRDEDGSLEWYVNTNSGRFCRDTPPTKAQEQNLLDLLKTLTGHNVKLDDIEEAV